MKVEKIRIKIDGEWIDIKEEHKIQNCEAIEITEYLKLQEVEEHYKECYPELYLKYFN